jgi:hypothetical protein
MEAEYHVIASATTKVNHLIRLVREFGVTLSSTPTVYCDNVGATYLYPNLVFHSRMKNFATLFMIQLLNV